MSEQSTGLGWTSFELMEQFSSRYYSGLTDDFRADVSVFLKQLEKLPADHASLLFFTTLLRCSRFNLQCFRHLITRVPDAFVGEVAKYTNAFFGSFMREEQRMLAGALFGVKASSGSSYSSTFTPEVYRACQEVSSLNINRNVLRRLKSLAFSDSQQETLWTNEEFRRRCDANLPDEDLIVGLSSVTDLRIVLARLRKLEEPEPETIRARSVAEVLLTLESAREQPEAQATPSDRLRRQVAVEAEVRLAKADVLRHLRAVLIQKENLELDETRENLIFLLLQTGIPEVAELFIAHSSFTPATEISGDKFSFGDAILRYASVEMLQVFLEDARFDVPALSSSLSSTALQATIEQRCRKMSQASDADRDFINYLLHPKQQRLFGSSAQYTESLLTATKRLLKSFLRSADLLGLQHFLASAIFQELEKTFQDDQSLLAAEELLSELLSNRPSDSSRENTKKATEMQQLFFSALTPRSFLQFAKALQSIGAEYSKHFSMSLPILAHSCELLFGTTQDQLTPLSAAVVESVCKHASLTESTATLKTLQFVKKHQLSKKDLRRFLETPSLKRAIQAGLITSRAEALSFLKTQPKASSKASKLL